MLFEIATDTPGIAALDMVRSGQAKVGSYEEALVTSGFWIDETSDEAGLSLSLPPHLFQEQKRKRHELQLLYDVWIRQMHFEIEN